VPVIVGDRVETPVITDTLGSWVAVVAEVEVPNDAEYARVEATRNPLGQFDSVWFDDIHFGLGTCLELVKTSDPNDVPPGDPLTYTIVYSNYGREAASEIVIQEIYDEFVQFDHAIPEPVSGTNDVWEIGDLPAGGSGVITVWVDVDEYSVNQNWLVNKASIDAQEIMEPISDVLYTGVDTEDVCAVDLLAYPEVQVGKPGQTVNYELELRNVGRFQGDATLTSLSDLGLDVTFDPVTQTLIISESSSAAMSIYVPPTVTIPSTDTTWITVTLACYPGTLVDDALEPVSTKVTYFTQMVPTLMNDYCGAETWEIEPNDTCEQAHGPICLEHEFYGYPDDRDDYYLVYAPEGGIVVDLYSGSGGIPASEGIQLGVCPPDPLCPINCYWDSVPEDGYHLELPGISGPYYIRIFKAKPYSIDWTYTLRVSAY
jgi:uncharacterized repeat protein (TIGR01451 family)